MKKKTVHTGGKKTVGLLFQGEMMTCVMCKKEQQSDPKVESNWTAIQADEQVFYICPTCFAKVPSSMK
ncbi:MAG: hypothetical protein LCI00_05415 [Chloroflexi bacterium]|nr:hypothetical protein [Chloroflexota bacterium]